MESWTFLIQKEGDTVWLPLDMPESEILEGRYRIMGRTNRTHCPVAIQVSYLDMDVFPPRRKVQKRQARTNRKGLVALLPFMHLKPGLWDVRCQSPLADPDQSSSETSSDGDRSPSSSPSKECHTLQIQVLAKDMEADVESEPPELTHAPIAVAGSPGVDESRQESRQSNASAPTAPPTAPPTASQGDPEPLLENGMEEILAAADQMADQIIATMKANLQPSSSPSSLPRPQQPSAPAAPSPRSMLTPDGNPDRRSDTIPAPVEVPGLALVLDQIAYVVSTNAPLILTGQVVDLGKHGNNTWDGFTFKLQAQLIHPQTGDRLLSEQSTLPRLSSPFRLSLPIPSQLDTHLLMGDLTLTAFPNSVAAAPDASPLSASPPGSPSTSGQILARQPFTVTVALGTLLDHLNRVAPSQPNRDKVPLSSTPDLELTDAQLQLPDPTLALTIEATQQGRSPQTYNPLPPKLSPLANTTMPEASTDSPLPPPPPPPPTSAEQPPDLPSFLQTEDQRPPSALAIAIGQAMGDAPSGSAPSSGQGEPHSLSEQPGAQTELPAESDRPQSNGPTNQPVAPRNGNQASTEIADPMTNPFGELSWDVLEETAPSRPTSPSIAGETFEPSKIAPSAMDTATEPTVEPPTVDEPTVEPPTVDEPTVDEPTVDQPIIELATVDEPITNSGIATMINEAAIADGQATDEPLPESARTLNRLSQISHMDASHQRGNQAAPGASMDRGEGLRSPQPEPPEPQPSLALPTLPPQVSIPTPMIQLPDQDLIAGHPVRLVVTLPTPRPIAPTAVSDNQTADPRLIENPPMQPFIFVKLWVQDRQTRSILDGPRWLVDFIPNRQGDLEAMTQLVLPIGCMEVSVAAIAVELLTQRESNKVTLHRSVTPTTLPPPLTSFSLDDLN